jgi:hypothetical protein
MSNTRTASRPQRPTKQTPQVKPLKTMQQISRVEKTQRKTNKLALQNNTKYIQSWLHSSVETQQEVTPIRPRTTEKTTIRQLISDEVSSGEEDTSEDEDTESVEKVDLTHENIEYRAADEIRRASFDSRCGPGNEIYELDDFVVGDSDESEHESVSSEITAMRKVSGCSLRPRPSVISIARRSSMRSTKSGCSAVEQDVGDADDVVEVIMDTMALLSRRCNRTLRPRKFVLAADILEDEAVRDVLDDAVRLGLGRLVSSSDGTEVWVIGPKM